MYVLLTPLAPWISNYFNNSPFKYYSAKVAEDNSELRCKVSMFVYIYLSVRVSLLIISWHLLRQSRSFLSLKLQQTSLVLTFMALSLQGALYFPLLGHTEILPLLYSFGGIKFPNV